MYYILYKMTNKILIIILAIALLMLVCQVYDKRNEPRVSPQPLSTILEEIEEKNLVTLDDIVKRSNQMDNVIDNIYISNWTCAINKDLLIKNNIKYILCLNKEFRKTKQDMDLYNSLGIKHLYIEIDDRDTENITEKFNECLKFIQDSSSYTLENGNIL